MADSHQVVEESGDFPGGSVDREIGQTESVLAIGIVALMALTVLVGSLLVS